MTQKRCGAVGSVNAADPDGEEAHGQTMSRLSLVENVAPFLSVMGVIWFPIGTKCGQHPRCVSNSLVILKVFFSRSQKDLTATKVMCDT